MFNKKRAAWNLLLLSSVVPLLLSCSSDDSRTLHLLEKPVPAESESERLRKMQLIRVVYTDTDPPQESTETAYGLSQFLLQDVCPPTPLSTWNECDANLANVQKFHCATKALLAAASPQSHALQFGNYIIPPQTSAATAEIADYAAIVSSWAWGAATDDLLGLVGVVPNTGCTPSDARLADDFSGLYADIYQTRKELSEIVVKSGVDASDAQFSSTTSLDQAEARAISGAEVSRAAVAHSLVGGDAGLLGDTTKGFCSSPELSPEGKAALSVIRESAISPTAIVKSDGVGRIDIDTLLNDTGTAVPEGGSVRQRLAELYQYPALLAGTPVEQYYGLTLNAFSEARAYLKEEIHAFSRSLSATLPAKTLSGGGATTRARFSATAGPPVPLPAAYYAALARYSENEGSPFTDPPATTPVYARLDSFIDASLTRAAQIVGASANEGVALPAGGIAPLALLLAAKERTARITFTNTSSTDVKVTVAGFTKDDGLRLLVGEDELRCAVQGSIEGGSIEGARTEGGVCSNLGTAITTPAETVPLGFDSATEISGLSIASGKKRLYVVRPKQGTALITATAGQYEALAGLSVDTSRADTIAVPVIPSLEERVAKVLEPSKAWCAHSKVSCAGADFDERLPLENELSSDQDGVESSWKHYLSLAKEAAAQADALGTDYVNAGLQTTQNALDVETRREQQLERADDEIQKLQATCGTSVDPRKLLTLLSTGSTANVANASGASCDSANPCTGRGQFCTKSGLAASLRNGKGICLVDLERLAATDQAGDPDLKRLADCLNDPKLEPFLSLGTKPLCLWYSNANPNLICSGSSSSTPCPVVLNSATKPNGIGKVSDYSHIEFPRSTTICDNALPNPPTGTTRAVSRNMGFFDVGTSSNVGTNCNGFRRARHKPSDAEYQGLMENRTFDITKLRFAAGRINYEMRYGGYASINVDNSPRFTTGDAFVAGPNTTSWPCVAPPASCESVPGELLKTTAGLMCAHYDCTVPSERAKANYLMLRAVLAAKTVGAESNAFLLGQGIAEFSLPGESQDSWNSDAWGEIRFGNPNNLLTFWGPGGFSATRTNGKDRAKYIIREDAFGLLPGIVWYDESGNALRQDHGGADETQRAVARAKLDCPGEDGKPLKDLQKPVCPYLYGMGEKDTSWLASRVRGTSKDDVNIPYEFGFGGETKDHDLVVGNFTDPRAKKIFLRGGGRLGNINDDDSTVAPPVVVGAQDLLNGYELLCGVSEGEGAEVSLAAPPIVSSVADVSKVASYIKTVAQALKVQAGTRLFANVPSAAISAMERAGGNGSYPQYGGDMGVAISKLRGGLVRLQETIPLLSNEMEGFGYDMQILHDTLARFAIKNKIEDLQLWSNVSNQLASCAATVNIKNIFSLSTIATCVNSVAQISIASKINELGEEDTALQSAIATLEFGEKFATHATNLQTLSLHFAEASEDVDSSLATIDSLHAQAKVSLARAVDLASYQAENAATHTQVLANLYDGKQIRYRQALQTAKRMAFLAKRAIEQRLGTRLSEMREPLPLVDAPSTWEATGCTMTGLNYNNPDLPPDASLTNVGGAKKFAEGFIGDYVTKLANVVESYQLVNSFHEGTDTAVISLRDDIMNVRAPCEVPSPNLLYYTSNLQQFGSPGWKQENCSTEEVEGVSVPAANCVSVNNVGAIPLSVLPDPTLANTSAYSLQFGSGATTSVRMSQTIDLKPGSYRLSWYTPDSAGSNAGFVTAAANSITSDPTGGTAPVFGAWGRRFITFNVAAMDGSTSTPVTVGFAPCAPALTGCPALSASNANFKVAGPMLEKLPDVQGTYALTPFVGTGGKLTTTRPACQDTDGALFRTSNWQVGCQQLCADGFASQCDTASAKSYCYHQASFGLSQRDIQQGKVLNFSGFARGNFNYRIDSVAVNFVGSGARDCSSSTSPSACYGAGFIPYSLGHVGPFYVRNYEGRDFQALLFDGNIEHARGLGSERYLTNPLSSSDQSLIEQYMRGEFQGRPLDGNFVLRVWDEDGVDFNSIADVQLVLKYRYWTRQN